jgi:hypothetical protein
MLILVIADNLPDIAFRSFINPSGTFPEAYFAVGRDSFQIDFKISGFDRISDNSGCFQYTGSYRQNTGSNKRNSDKFSPARHKAIY